MTAAEFSSIVSRLGWSEDRAAAELGVAPHVVAAWAAGSVKIPSRIATVLQWQSAVTERLAVVSASGLPECGAVGALERAAEGARGQAFVTAMEVLNTHVDSCPTCKARVAYAEQHGPPVPELPVPLWVRAVKGGVSAYQRLPAPIRPPDGERGHGRRMGLVFGVGFSALVFVMVLLRLLTGRGAESPLEGLRFLAVISVGYLIGFYLAGIVYDLLYPIGHTLAGHMLRWGLGAAMVYGTIALISPALSDEPQSFRDVAEFAGFVGVVWSVIGAGMWARQRWLTRKA